MSVNWEGFLLLISLIVLYRHFHLLYEQDPIFAEVGLLLMSALILPGGEEVSRISVGLKGLAQRIFWKAGGGGNSVSGSTQLAAGVKTEDSTCFYFPFI